MVQPNYGLHLTLYHSFPCQEAGKGFFVYGRRAVRKTVAEPPYRGMGSPSLSPPSPEESSLVGSGVGVGVGNDVCVGSGIGVASSVNGVASPPEPSVSAGAEVDLSVSASDFPGSFAGSPAGTADGSATGAAVAGTVFWAGFDLDDTKQTTNITARIGYNRFEDVKLPARF